MGEGREFFKTLVETLATRTRRALMEKVSWYKGKAWNNFMKGKPLEKSKPMEDPEEGSR